MTAKNTDLKSDRVKDLTEPKNRSELKVAEKNVVQPADFTALVYSGLNIKDDGIVKPESLPLRICVNKDDKGKDSAHRLDLVTEQITGSGWRLSTPSKRTYDEGSKEINISEPALTITYGSSKVNDWHPSKLYIGGSTGKVGINTYNPEAQLHVQQGQESIELFKLKLFKNSEVVINVDKDGKTQINKPVILGGGLTVNTALKVGDTEITSISDKSLGDSNAALATDKVVKEYVDNQLSSAKNTLANKNGDKGEDFDAKNIHAHSDLNVDGKVYAHNIELTGEDAICFSGKNFSLKAKSNKNGNKLPFLWPKYSDEDNLYINFGNEISDKSHLYIRDHKTQNAAGDEHAIIDITKDQLAVNGKVYAQDIEVTSGTAICFSGLNVNLKAKSNKNGNNLPFLWPKYSDEDNLYINFGNEISDKSHLYIRDHKTQNAAGDKHAIIDITKDQLKVNGNIIANNLEVSGSPGISFNRRDVVLEAMSGGGKKLPFFWPKVGKHDNLYINFGNESSHESHFYIRDHNSLVNGQKEIVDITKDQLAVNGKVYAHNIELTSEAAICFSGSDVSLKAKSNKNGNELPFFWPKVGEHDSLYMSFGNESSHESHFYIRDHNSSSVRGNPPVIDITKDQLAVNGNLNIGGNITCNDIQGRDIVAQNNLTVKGTIYGKVGYQAQGHWFYLSDTGDSSSGRHAYWRAENSDIRLKKEIQPLEHAVEKLLKINGVAFKWNELGINQKIHQEIESIFAGPDATEEENQKVKEQTRAELTDKLSGQQIGFIAQEVEQVFPEVVSEDETGYKRVDYAVLTAVLVEAVKEQQAAYQKLSDEFETLSQRLLLLESKVS